LIDIIGKTCLQLYCNFRFRCCCGIQYIRER